MNFMYKSGSKLRLDRTNLNFEPLTEIVDREVKSFVSISTSGAFWVKFIFS